MANYCTIESLKSLLPTSITIGTASQNQPTLQVTAGRESLSEKGAREFIRLASQQVDSRLSPVYIAPLKRIKIHETELTGNVSRGGTILTVRDHGPFTVGSLLRITDTRVSDLYEVEDVGDSPSDMGKITITPAAVRDYATGYSPLVSLIEYPDPVPLICARLTVGMIIDRMFVAEQSPDVSTYGQSLRAQAGNDIDLILQGAIRLHGQEHNGSRFGRYSVFNAVKLPSFEVQPGQMGS